MRSLLVRVATLGLPLASVVCAVLGGAVTGCESSSSPPAATFGAEAGTAFVPDASPAADASTAPPDASTAPPDADAPDAAAVDASKPVTFATTLPFNTGLDNARVALADVAIDPHWTVKNGAGMALPAYVQTDALGFPGFWLAPSATSKFLSPFVDTNDAAAVGPFTYTTTFSLRTGVVLATTSLSVSYASDNATDSIQLNGTAIAGVTPGSYGAFITLPISGPFVVGTNTISFVSSNSGGPTGFRAELVLTTN